MAEHKVVSEIAGSVWKVHVKPGDAVKEGEPLLVIESMKMEIEVLSPCNGTVRFVAAAEGQAIAEGEVPIVIDG